MGRRHDEGEAPDWRDVRHYVRKRGAKTIAQDVLSAFEDNRILTYASAVSFQLLFAAIPLVLAGVAVLGFLDLEEVWRNEVGPRFEERVSDAVFEVVDQSVESVLGSQRGFWLTLGLGLALWELSGAVRATMGALNDIYDVGEARSFLRRMGVSFLLALALALLLGLAVIGLQLIPRLAGVLDLAGLAILAVPAAWLAAVALMIVAIALLMRFGPAQPQSMGWLGFGTLLVVVGWAVASTGFAAYAARIASYSTIYGSLGVVILLLTYIYLSALVFLGGAQVDQLVRRYAGDAG
jgi:membrane protein